MMMVMELGSWVMVPNFGAYILIGMMFVELLEVWIFRKTASLVEDFKYHKTTTEKWVNDEGQVDKKYPIDAR